MHGSLVSEWYSRQRKYTTLYSVNVIRDIVVNVTGLLLYEPLIYMERKHYFAWTNLANVYHYLKWC